MDAFDRWLRRIGEWLFSSRSVSASYIQSLAPAVERYGLDPVVLMREVGLNPDLIAQPGYRAPLFHAFRLAELATARSGNPCFGLELGREVRAKSFQVLGYAAMSSRTLHGAILALQRYEQLVWDIGATKLTLDDETAVLSLMPEGVSLVPEQVIEMSISGWIHFGQWIMRDPGEIKEAWFRHAAIGPAERYEAILGCPVRFEQPTNGISFSSVLLDAPLREADEALHALMSEQGERLLADYARDTNLPNEVRAHVCRVLRDGEPDIDAVATSLGMTGRILRRRLSKAGFSFQGLLDDVRRDLAFGYLDHGDLSLLDVAFMLGFSDQSAFNRAFKRWTGLAPGQYKAGRSGKAS